jgi:hypothetical protein
MTKLLVGFRNFANAPKNYTEREVITQFSATWPADVSWPDVTETQVANTFHWVTTLYCLLETWSHKKSFCFSLKHLLETALRQIFLHGGTHACRP